MQFESIEAFFSMGGYGGYVFSVYGLGIAIIAWNLLQPVLRQKRFFVANALHKNNPRADAHHQPMEGNGTT